MSIFNDFICLDCDNSDCDRTGITCTVCNPRISSNGKCLDFEDKAGEGTSQLTNEVS